MTKRKKNIPIRKKWQKTLNCLYFTVVLCSLQCFVVFIFLQTISFFHFIIKSSEILGSGLALDSIFFLVPSLITNVCRSGSLYHKDTFNRGVFGVVFVFLWNCVSSFNSIVTSFVLTGFFCDARVNWIGGGGVHLISSKGLAGLGWVRAVGVGSDFLIGCINDVISAKCQHYK